MAFTNSITIYNTQTLNHCDVFNEVNMILLQNTLWNKKLIESVSQVTEQNTQNITNTEQNITNITQKLNTAIQDIANATQDITDLIRVVDAIPSNARQNQLFFKKI